MLANSSTLARGKGSLRTRLWIQEPQRRGSSVPNSNPKSDKYANKSPQFRDAGFLVTLGGPDEIAHH